MAATTADRTRLDAILKDRPVVDSIQDIVNKATPLAERITNTLPLSGRQGIFPVQSGVNQGVYARNEKEALGDSQVDKPDLASVTAKNIYAVFEITGQVMSATRDTPGAFEEALGLTLENTIDGVKLDVARQIVGDGSGTIALVQSRVDTDTYMVDSPFGLSRYKSNRPVKTLLQVNMPIDVNDAGDGTTAHVSNSAITAVTPGTTETTIDFSPVEVDALAVDGDFVTRNSNRNKEIEGLLAAIDTTGSYLGIARAGKPGWQGVLTDAAGGGAAAVPLDPDHLRDTVDAIVETTGIEPEFLVMNLRQRRNFYNLSAAQIRFVPMLLPQGMRDETLSFDDMSVLTERFFPPEHIGIVNTRFWFHAIDTEVEWFQGLNGTVLHMFEKKDLFTAILRTYRNLVCLYPATNAFIFGLEE